MRLIKIILLLNGIILFCNFAEAQTQPQLNAEACKKAENAETKMSRMLARIYTDYKKEEAFVERMKSAQTVWKQFYDAELEAEFPLSKDENPLYKYGSAYPMCYCIARERLIYERIEQLKVWIDGNPEGDVCTGSVKVVEKKAVTKAKYKSTVRRKRRIGKN